MHPLSIFLDHLIVDKAHCYRIVIDFMNYKSCLFSIPKLSLFFISSLVRVWTFVWSTHMALVTMVKVDITTSTPPLILWNIRGTSCLRSTSTALTGPRKLTRLVEIENEMSGAFVSSVFHQLNIKYTFNTQLYSYLFYL